MGENIFPVSFEDFRRHTNVRDLANNLATKNKSSSGENFKQNRRKFEYLIYNTYFQSPQAYSKIEIQETCPEDIRQLLLQRVHYPVKFGEFKRYTNVLQHAESILKKQGNTQPKAEHIEELALTIYYNFYTYTKLESNAALKIKPCIERLKRRLTATATYRNDSEAFEVREPECKRKRIDSNLADSTTNIPEAEINVREDEIYTPKNEVIPQLLPQQEPSNNVNQEPEPRKLNSILILKGANFDDEFLHKYVTAYLCRKAKTIVQGVKETIEKERMTESLQQDQIFVKLKKPGTGKLIPYSKGQKQSSEIDAFVNFFKKSDIFYRLSFITNNEFKSQLISALNSMSIEEFRFYTRILGAPNEIYNNFDILQRCYTFALRNPKVWPVNLYIPLKDLFAFMKKKHLQYTFNDLREISPSIVMWNDLPLFTNFDECVFKGNQKCMEHIDKKRKLFYDVCWTFNTWIDCCPKFIDPSESKETNENVEGVIKSENNESTSSVNLEN